MTIPTVSTTARRSIRLAVVALVIVGIHLAGSASTSGPVGPRDQLIVVRTPHMAAI